MSATKIDWHPYPEEKPKNGDSYLITVQKNSGSLCIGSAFFDYDDWITFYSKVKIIAWAEQPEPYRPEVNDD